MVMTSARVASLTNRYLRHTCTLVEPGAAAGFDDYGEPVAGDPVAHAGVACWAYQPPARGEIVEPGRQLVAHTWRVLVPAATVVAESWQVADVRDEAGAAIVAGPLAITEVVRYRGHLTIVAQQAATGDTAP